MKNILEMLENFISKNSSENASVFFWGEVEMPEVMLKKNEQGNAIKKNND